MSEEKGSGDSKEKDDPDRERYSWPWPYSLPTSGRYAALQERIIRDHQKQLSQIGRKVSSGDYTPQSMVAEAWRFSARVWGDWADWTRISYGLDVQRMKESSGELSVHLMRAVRRDESPSLVISIESARLPEGSSRLKVHSLKSSEGDYVISGENISFEPDTVQPDVRGVQEVKVIVTKLAFDGNQVSPGLYTGTIKAGSRALGLLVLELVESGR